MLMLVAVLAVAVLAGDVAIRRLAPSLAGSPRAVAWSLAATAAVLIEHGVPLALGVLSRASVLVTTGVLAAAAIVAARGTRVRGTEPVGARVSRGPVWLGVVATVLAVGAVLAFLREHAAEPALASDTLNFQLPQVARWIQTGSLWQLDQFFPDYSNATYPHHGNLLLLAAVLPFGDTELARLVGVPFFALTALAVFAAALELGAARGWALLAAALTLAVPISVAQTLDGANTDAPMTFFFAAGVLFGLRHHRTAARADLVLAGVALGLALGTKWYALTTLPPLLLVWAYARHRARDRWLADGARAVGLIALAGGLWLVRNTIETGNPLFPQWLGPLPSPRDVYRETAGSTLADYLTDPGVWRTYLEPQFTRFFAAPGYALAAAPVVALLMTRRGRAAAVAAAALACLAVYLVTPYSALGPQGMPITAYASMRYAVPALLLGAIVLAWLGTRAPRWTALLAVAAVVQGVVVEYELDTGLVVTSVVIVAVLAAPARLADRRLAAFGTAAVLVLAVAGVRADSRPGGYDADPVLAWVQANAPRDTRIALAGFWPVDGLAPVLPAFGPELDNDVAFAGHFVDGMLRDETSAAAFAERVRGFDAVIIGRGVTLASAAGRPAPEEAWAQAAGFTPVVSSTGLALLARP